MAEPNGSSSMGMMVGIVLAVVLLIGGFVFLGGPGLFGGETKSVDVEVSAPSVPSVPTPDAAK